MVPSQSDTSIDHVFLEVEDPEAFGRELNGRYGMRIVSTGLFRPHAEGRLTIPLGDSFIELVPATIENPTAGHGQQRNIVRFGWGVRVPDLDAVAARLGSRPLKSAPPGLNGGVETWQMRLVGVEQAAVDTWLPYFVEWLSPPEQRPSYIAPSGHACRGVIREVEVGGDESRLLSWLGDVVVPVTCTGGPQGVKRVRIAVGDQVLVLSAAEPHKQLRFRPIVQAVARRDSFSSFSKASRALIVAAADEARELCHREIETLHFVLAAIANNSNFRDRLSAARAAARPLRPTDPQLQGHLPFSDELKRFFEDVKTVNTCRVIEPPNLATCFGPGSTAMKLLRELNWTEPEHILENLFGEVEF